MRVQDYASPLARQTPLDLLRANLAVLSDIGEALLPPAELKHAPLRAEVGEGLCVRLHRRAGEQPPDGRMLRFEDRDVVHEHMAEERKLLEELIASEAWM